MSISKSRSRLLKQRPNIRPFDFSGLKDLGIVWADYKAGNFYLEPGLTNEQFIQRFHQIVVLWDSLWLVEDNVPQYSSGRGPVGIIGVRTDGWRVEPHVHHFAWSTPRRKLRTWVGLLQWLRYSDVGLIMAIVEAKDKSFFDHLCEYGVLQPKGGEIHSALPTGSGYMFVSKGKRKCRGQQFSQHLSEQQEQSAQQQ